MAVTNLKAAADAVFSLMEERDWFVMYVQLNHEQNAKFNAHLHTLDGEEAREKAIRAMDRKLGMGS